MSARPSSRPTHAEQDLARWLTVLIAVAAWSIVPPYVGPLLGLELDVSATIEASAHLIPGLLAVGAAGGALLLARRGQFDSLLAFAALAVCALAGLFETVSHVALVRDAGEPLQPVGAVVLHASPGPVLLALALWLLLRPLPSEEQ
ncbi:MAG: hypothetical protein ACR2H2_09340 [Solirubrobacteraceae bacterium]